MRNSACFVGLACLALLLRLSHDQAAPAAEPAQPNASPNAMITVVNQGKTNLSIYMAPVGTEQWEEFNIGAGASLPITRVKGRYQALWGSYGAGGMGSIVPGTQNGKADDLPVQKNETWLFTQESVTPTVKAWVRKAQASTAGAIGGNSAARNPTPEKSPAGELVKEQGIETRLLQGWKRAPRASKGFDIEFRKSLSGGAEAALAIKRQTIPPESLKKPLNPADARKQFEEAMKQQYPGVTAQAAPAVKVRGQMMFNVLFDVTKDGKPFRLRCAYFIQESTAFLIQCSAPPEKWNALAPEFDDMMADVKAAN